MFEYSCLSQWSTNYGPWDKYGPLPIYVSKAFLEHIHTISIHLCIIYSYFPAMVADPGECNRYSMAHQAENAYHLAL